jgi:predicted metal-dependent hydrolase
MTSELMFSGGGREQPLVVIRRRGVKGMRLSIDPRDASVRLSLPLRAPLRPALTWAAGKRAWIEAELAKMPRGEPIVPGMRLCVAGEEVRLDWHPEYPRTPKLVIPAKAGIQRPNLEPLALDSRLRGNDESCLKVGGPIEQMPARVLRFLKRFALETLTRETFELADAHNIMISKVGVGDPKSRWGSCASSGDIRYSWRLILAPRHVRRATVAHEVAHRIHMNHSREFHMLVAELYGADPSSSRRWLRANGTALHWFGRGND